MYVNDNTTKYCVRIPRGKFCQILESARGTSGLKLRIRLSNSQTVSCMLRTTLRSTVELYRQSAVLTADHRTAQWGGGETSD